VVRVMHGLRIPGWAGFAARWMIGIGIVVVLLTRFDLGEVARVLGRADLRLALPAILGLVGMHLVGAATWRLLAISLGRHRLPWRRAVRTYYVAQGLGSLTPANLGSDAYRAAAVGPEQARWRDGLVPIVVQRITSTVALGALGVAALIWLPAGSSLGGLVAGAALVLVIGSSLLVLFLRWPSSSGLVAARGATPEPAPPRLAINDVAAGAGVGFALGLAFHAGSIGLSLLLVMAVSPVRDPVAVLACLAIARLSILVPIAPSGLGIQEGALTLLFLRIGLPAEVALAAGLLNRMALLATAGIGGALLATDRRHGRERAAVVAAARERGSSSLPAS
jgi:glycosyltransferase 2 family protein